MVNLSNDAILRIQTMMGDKELGDEVIARMSYLEVPPKTEDNCRAILDSTYSILDEKITQVLKSKMANYDHGECGLEIAKGLTGALKIIELHLAGQDYDILTLMGEKMDRVAFEALILALSSNQAAKEFRNAYNKMFDSLINLNVVRNPSADTFSSKKMHEETLPVEVLVDAKQDRVHEEKRSLVRKRIRVKKILA